MMDLVLGFVAFSVVLVLFKLCLPQGGKSVGSSALNGTVCCGRDNSCPGSWSWIGSAGAIGLVL